MQKAAIIIFLVMVLAITIPMVAMLINGLREMRQDEKRLRKIQRRRDELWRQFSQNQ